jgi:hypothetical protein
MFESSCRTSANRPSTRIEAGKEAPASQKTKIKNFNSVRGEISGIATKSFFYLSSLDAQLF